MDRFTTGLWNPGGTNWSGYTKHNWKGPGGNMRLRVEVDSDKPNDCGVVLHTNANNNKNVSDFWEIPMKKVGQWGKHCAFEASVKMNKVGAYRFAAATVHNGGGRHWMGNDGVSDTVIRPFNSDFNALNTKEIQIDQANDGTFEAMVSGGPKDYTLEKLAKDGVNAIWLMPPFETKPWEHRHHMDDKGSPYAVTDYHSIKRGSSRAARQLIKAGQDDKWGEKSRDAANAEFKKFIDKAHKLGIKIFLDVALNHVGHGYDFRDRIKKPDGSTRIERNNFTQVAINKAHIDTIEARLKDPKVPKTMEFLNEAFYGKRGADGGADRFGAKTLNDMVSGGWGEWPDTKQLNHGGMWGAGNANTAENWAVLNWYSRMLSFWAADMGVDGYRFDHATGLPPEFFEVCLNQVQAEVDDKRPGTTLYYMAEDFHHVDRNRKFVDNIQGGWFKELVKSRNTSRIKNVIENDYFQECTAGGSHDEVRAENYFGGDVNASTRFQVLLKLFGGPHFTVMGDEYLEGKSLRFKQFDKVPTILQAKDGTLADANIRAHKLITQAGKMKTDLPALKTDERRWLKNWDGYTDETLLAMARHADDGSNQTALVFGNLENLNTRTSKFHLDSWTKSKLDPNKKYNLRDVMSPGNEHKHVWGQARTGKDLMDNGITAIVKPYQVQALVIEEVG